MIATASEILAAFSSLGIVAELIGPDQPVHRISPVEDCGPGDLVFVDRSKFVAIVAERSPSVVVTSPKLKSLLTETGATSLLLAPNVNLAQALIKQRYAGRQFDAAGWPRIHPSAVVHETAMVAATAVVEPRAVIGRNVRLGERARIMSGAVVEHDAQVGSDTVVHPNAVIGYGCIIGDDANIGAGSVVGSEGYGFAQDEKGRSHPIPQTGNVVVGDRVRLGANCCIDRAAYRTTRIGAGTKFDNLCHIAHNVEIGEDCLLTAMFCVGGSTTIGNRVMASGQAGAADHVKICDDVVLLHRAAPVADIEKPGAYAGLPVQPFKEYMRNIAASRTLANIRSRVMALERGHPASTNSRPPATTEESDSG